MTYLDHTARRGVADGIMIKTEKSRGISLSTPPRQIGVRYLNLVRDLVATVKRGVVTRRTDPS
jgi:hypothetical protein